MKRFFIGLVDIASCIDDWRYGLEANGCAVLTGSRYKQAVYQNSKLDFVIQKAKDRAYFRPGRISMRLKPWWDVKVEKYYFNKAVKKSDFFIFLWTSFSSQFSDYKILKEKGKKIIKLSVGSDVRWYYAMKQEFEGLGLPIMNEDDSYHSNEEQLEQQLICLRNAEKYSDIMFARPDLMQLAMRPYYDLPLPIIPDEYFHKPAQRRIPIIVHAPTSVLFKGTVYIENVIDKLKKEGIAFEYKRIENVPRARALEIYGDSDIIVDQVLCPGSGKLAREGLAMGKVVLASMGYDNYIQKALPNCPIVDVNPANLYDVLKSLILDYDRRVAMAKLGRVYIEEHNSPKAICRHLLEILDTPPENRKPDFYPTFFRDKFIPESEESIAVYNKWTDYVKDCDWYNANVKSGERAELKF